MVFKIWWYLPVFIISALFVVVVLPAIVRTANKMNLFDSQDERKVHSGNVPRLGGVSFFPSIVFTLMMVISAMSIYSPITMWFGYGSITEVMMALAGCVMLYLVGIIDDVIGVSYKFKFLMQIAAAFLVCVSGLWIKDLYGLFGIHSLHPLIGIPLTITLIVLIINSINLIDGIDGLASGLCIIATVGYSIVFFLFDKNIYMLLACAMLGILIVFYFYNTLGKVGSTKIFMGDTGSLTMGFLLAFFAIKVATLDRSMFHKDLEGAYFVYAASVVLIPVMDVFRVFFARVRDAKGPFYPDKRHIHHKILALGYTMRQTRYMIFALSGFFICLNVLLYAYLKFNINLILVINATLWITFNIGVSNKVLRRRIANDPVALMYSDIGAGYKFKKREPKQK